MSGPKWFAVKFCQNSLKFTKRIFVAAPFKFFEIFCFSWLLAKCPQSHRLIFERVTKDFLTHSEAIKHSLISLIFSCSISRIIFLMKLNSCPILRYHLSFFPNINYLFLVFIFQTWKISKSNSSI